MSQVMLRGLSKQFDQTVIIKDLALTIADQEFLVLVGPSGCGKSTILRMIAGLETPTEGQILIDNQVVNHVHPKDRDIAMVFQNYALYPHMSVFDNMAFSLKMRKFPKADIKTRVEDAAQILDLSHLLTRKPKQLSGGQRQRVALGRAIVRDPKVFLMDEPLSNLDAKLRVQMRAEIRKLHKRLKATTVYVTHDQTEAMTMGDRIVVLHQGVIQQVGAPETVYKYPENIFVGAFVGSMSFLSGQVSGEQLTLSPDCSIPLPKEILKHVKPNQTLKVGIRPEHVRLAQAENDGATFPITPSWVEVLGHEQRVHFTLADQPMIGSLDTTTMIQEGNPLFITLNLAQVSWFDGQTGLNIVPLPKR